MTGTAGRGLGAGFEGDVGLTLTLDGTAGVGVSASSGGTTALGLHQFTAIGEGVGVSGTAAVAHVGPQLEWRFSGTPISHMGSIGTLPGVTVTAAGGLNGDGVGTLRAGATGTELSWRAPGSASFGAAVTITADAAVTLLDGDDPDKWIQLSVNYASLPTGPLAARVALATAAGTSLSSGDVDAADALAGRVDTYSVTLYNLGSAVAANSMNTVYAWIDRDTTGMEISWDGVSWYAPQTEAEAAAGMGGTTIAGASGVTLHLRRTIAAATAADPLRPLTLHVSWDNQEGGRAESVGRTTYRVENAAEYRFYRKLNEPPAPGADTPYATSASLPATPATTFGDGTWYLGMTYFNGYVESGLLRTAVLNVLAGVEIAAPPSSPVAQWQELQPSGVVRVRAVYNPFGDRARVADEWAVWYTTDGSAPGSGSPQYTVAMTFIHGVANLSYDLPAQAHGTTVRTLVRARRSSGAGVSPNDTDDLTAAAATGPAAAVSKSDRPSRMPWISTAATG